MPAPKSPLTILAEKLSSMPVLKGYCKVLAGKDKLASGRAPPSIVLLPTTGPYSDADDNVESIVDVDLLVIARIWGENLDEAWELRKRYIQALRQQANGRPDDPENATAEEAGFYVAFDSEVWDAFVDTGQQGQELEAKVSIRLTAAPTIRLANGEIDSTELHGTQTTLTAALSAAAGTAMVESTDGFATAGALSIDSEQLSYTGITATSFTGLARGLNGTTPGDHASPATVTQ